VTQNIILAPMKALKRSRAEATSRAQDLLRQVGLSEFADRYPASLSGGQQQRVAIARALAMDPIAMLFDEPTSVLDPEMINEVLEVMTGLARDGMTMIVVTHEMGFARRVADRVVFMDDGAILEDTATEAFFAQPHTERAAQFVLATISWRGDAGATWLADRRCRELKKCSGTGVPGSQLSLVAAARNR
jgi:glutamate/aspartate transport system ATP-binding protein